jgi:AcrR family transcriptional regulator
MNRLPPAQLNRDRLVDQARRLFAARGYADVSVDEIAAAAELTKGAVYYQFKDKTDLFRAACEAALTDIAHEVTDSWAVLGAKDLDGLRTGSDRLFDAYESLEARRLLLIDGPAVLGFQTWMGMQERGAICIIANGLEAWVKRGCLPADQAPILAHMLFGAFIQGALRVAVADDPAKADREVRQAADTLVQNFIRGMAQGRGEVPE